MIDYKKLSALIESYIKDEKKAQNKAEWLSDEYNRIGEKIDLLLELWQDISEL